MQRNNEKTGEGAARQRLSDESDSQDTMLHADEEGAARQSDESDFQECRKPCAEEGAARPLDG